MTTSLYPCPKIQLRGPAPYGGTYFAPLSDPSVDRAIEDGWSIHRTWVVTGPTHSVQVWPA